MTKILAGILAVSLLGRASAEPKDVVGWVLQCSGHWTSRDGDGEPAQLACQNRRVNVWFPLRLETRLALTSHDRGQWIVVRIARTGETHRFDCDKPGECDPPPLPFARFVPNEPAGLLRGFFESPGEPYNRVRLLLSRSEQDDKLVTADHVVISESSHLTVRNLLRSTAPPGVYQLELCPFRVEGCPSEQKPVSLMWRPGAPSPWPQALRPGLYHVVRSKMIDGAPFRTSDRGLLLVVHDQNEAAIRAQVQEGEQLFLERWKDKAEGRLMFQALLVKLADQGL
jgi:hypothetical protein